MLRMSFMPSDYHPVLLVLGHHRDLQQLADILEAFSESGETVLLTQAGVYSTDTEVELSSSGEQDKPGLWKTSQEGRLGWKLSPEAARKFAYEVEDLAASGAPAGSVTLECELLGEIKVKVSIGEWEDHFLTDEAR